METIIEKPPAAADALRDALRRKISEESELYFGAVEPAWLDSVQDYFWDGSLQRVRVANLVRHGVRPDRDRVLDMAAGCGQFLIHSLEAGFDTLGLEPDPWRCRFVEDKMAALGKPREWAARVRCGRGEQLPFDDDHFDYVTSYQTLEHVQDPSAVIRELIRVTRVGGAIHIMCPDYRGTYEGHYRLPWLPLFPRALARAYLKLLGRPTAGLDTIRYVTRPRILRWLREAEADGRLLVCDENHVDFQNALRRRGLPEFPGAYLLWRMRHAVQSLGRSEFGCSLLIRVWQKPQSQEPGRSTGPQPA